MSQTEQIKEALLKLDVNNDELWTGDGLPKVEALSIPGIKRADITEAAPQFTRENPTIELPEGKQSDEDKAQAEIDNRVAEVMEHYEAADIEPSGETEEGATIFTLSGS